MADRAKVPYQAGIGRLFHRRPAEGDNELKADPNTIGGSPEVSAGEKQPAVDNGYPCSDSNSEEEEVQKGIRNAEAVTAVWTKRALIFAYVFIYLIFITNSLQQQIQGNLGIYIYSDFSAANLFSTSNILSSVIGAVVKLPIAKLIDIWGRAEGLIVMLAIQIIGLIMMACTNGVELYAAAQVFYWVGFGGVDYVLDIFISDTSSLKNRGLLFAFATSPFIFTTFAGPPAAESFYNTSGWRWGFGAFCIITPAITAPLAMLYFVNSNKARKQGVIVKSKSNRTIGQSFHHYAIEFDVIGMLLCIAAFTLFLLPFNFANTLQESWRSPQVIAMLVVGFVLFFVFAAYERFLAPKSFVPFHLLKDRTVMSSCILAMVLFISFYCWDWYFSFYLQVVYDLSLTNAGYIYGIYNIGSCFFGILIGILIRQTGNFKYVALAAIPFQMLGVGLMIYFRGGAGTVGYMIMCQIFIALSGGALVISEQIAILSRAKHGEIAIVLALQGLFVSIGGAIGISVTGAIYTNSFVPALQRYLPPELLDQANALWVGGPPAQKVYPVGSAARMAINMAWDDTMRYMCIAGICILPVGAVCILLFKGVDVRKIKQVGGTIID